MSVKFKSFDESDEALKSAKEERDIARTELKTFRKEKKIGAEDPTDEKILKTFNKMKATKEKKEAAVDEIVEWRKANKPKKERAVRDSKYTYPADCVSALDKKKFRAKARTAAKNAAKPPKAEKAAKPAKKGAEAEPAKKSKAERKAEKKAAAKEAKKEVVAED